MKKLLLAGLLSVGVACACDTYKCNQFMNSLQDFTELHNAKEIKADIFKEKIESAKKAYEISKRICYEFEVLSVNEIVSLQTKYHVSNLNDEMTKLCKDVDLGGV
ncbi:MAG: hypothetical protein SPJ16_09260 [Helicobacter sp.]|uniref:hypothetical protein n=1 Tax=Helicobacter sp. TaxID=218 RepID=UPI002A91608E|nr:hypothetical protein [Helicobacter sp.]MDY5951362.1 hypothetical protein [Helicobacter sp.]